NRGPPGRRTNRRATRPERSRWTNDSGSASSSTRHSPNGPRWWNRPNCLITAPGQFVFTLEGTAPRNPLSRFSRRTFLGEFEDSLIGLPPPASFLYWGTAHQYGE